MEKKPDKKISEEPRKNSEKCEKERDEYLNGWKRAKADFINYKKEEAERFREFAKFSNEALVSELIMVLDSFSLGLAVLSAEGGSASGGENKPAEKGMRLIKNQLEETLKKYGLEKITVKPGDVFDPAFHEGLKEVESVAPPGTIAEGIDIGYALNGKVIRPARVNLSKGQTKTITNNK
ncbi:nucleotide exchange factor GrpE [Candidatus Jorgensenbacteria bacterium GWA1_49_17]|uniref:Protein GrpE n=2 Tax=Candidatus Joergenseniibacteriota TaxID=1752739 RepID=A0A1F6BMD2_9BACT|nr:MAG: nucleotide exchange factor GrpE [Candidatus Jorgensenbacteria bacterium GWC1_48_12]OGG40059.1 MAG: nucleotide exchange factor GrpE [Candidatus Jorgensenbacteria bacterium GWA1_49_17]